MNKITHNLNIGILCSGRGSNLQAIIDACEKGVIPGNVVIVISDKADAHALERAKKHNIEAKHISPKQFSSKEEYEKQVLEALDKRKVNLVCLAGYMRIVGPTLVRHFSGRMMNIHPALLPAFPGLHGQKQALDYGVKMTGCTVHFVDEGCDTGPVILQQAVPVLGSDNEDTLSMRILEQEHKLYPKAIKLFAEGKLKIEGRKVVVKE